MRLLSLVIVGLALLLPGKAEARQFHLLDQTLSASGDGQALPDFEAQPLHFMDDGGGAGSSVGAFPWLIEAAVIYLGALTGAGLGFIVGAVVGGLATGSLVLLYVGAAVGSLLIGALSTMVLLAITSALFNAPGGNGLMAGVIVGGGMAVAVILQILVPALSWVSGLIGLALALGAEYVHRGGFPDFGAMNAPAGGSGDDQPYLEPTRFRPLLSANPG